MMRLVVVVAARAAVEVAVAAVVVVKPLRAPAQKPYAFRRLKTPKDPYAFRRLKKTLRLSAPKHP